MQREGFCGKEPGQPSGWVEAGSVGVARGRWRTCPDHVSSGHKGEAMGNPPQVCLREPFNCLHTFRCRVRPFNT